MINLKPFVFAALAGDAELIALLGGEKIYRTVPSEPAELPFIVYGELDNQPLAKGDEQELASEILMQFDVWSEANTTEIAQAVDRIVIGLGSTRERAPDDDEDDNPSLQRRILVYRFVVDQNNAIL